MISLTKRRRTTSEDVDAEILCQLTDMSKEEDEDSLFDQSIAASLKKMEPQKKSLAKIRLQQVLYEIEFSTPASYPAQLPPPMPGASGYIPESVTTTHSIVSPYPTPYSTMNNVMHFDETN